MNLNLFTIKSIIDYLKPAGFSVIFLLFSASLIFAQDFEVPSSFNPVRAIGMRGSFIDAANDAASAS